MKPLPLFQLLRPYVRGLKYAQQVWLKPSVATVDYCHATPFSIAAHTGTENTITVQPDYARNLTLQTVDNTGDDLAGTVRINGKDIHGDTILEDFTIVAGVDNVVGNKAFSEITSVTWNLPTSATSDTMTIGIGSKLGLLNSTTSVVRETFNGAARAVGTLYGTYNTYASGATMDGAKAIEIVYNVALFR
jgi:hypothetical protein